MDFRAEQQVSRSQQVLRRIQGDPRFSMPAIAASMGIPYDRLMSYVKGRAPFPADLAADLFAAVAEVDRALALWALTEIAGLREIGLELKPTARGTDPDPIPVDALQVTQALGALSGKITAAGSEIDHMEAAAMLPSARQLVAEAQQMVTKLEVISSITPQMKIPGAER